MLVQDLITSILIKLRITQATLAKLVDIDEPSLSTYLSGKRKPGIIAIMKLIDFANEQADMNLKYSDIETKRKTK